MKPKITFFCSFHTCTIQLFQWNLQKSQDMGMSVHLPISLSSSNLIYTSATFRIRSFHTLEFWRKKGKKGWFFHFSYWECWLLQLSDGLTVENVMTHRREWVEAIVFHGQSEWNDTKWSFRSISEISIVTEASNLYRFRKIHKNRSKTESTLRSQIWEGQKEPPSSSKMPFKDWHLTNTKEVSKPSTRQIWTQMPIIALLLFPLPVPATRSVKTGMRNLERNGILLQGSSLCLPLGAGAWGGLRVAPAYGSPDPSHASQGLWTTPRNGVKVQLLINYILITLWVAKAQLFRGRGSAEPTAEGSPAAPPWSQGGTSHTGGTSSPGKGLEAGTQEPPSCPSALSWGHLVAAGVPCLPGSPDSSVGSWAVASTRWL